jgi:hypothetical protein
MKGQPGLDARGTCHHSTDGSTNAAATRSYIANVRNDNFVWSPFGAGGAKPPLMNRF